MILIIFIVLGYVNTREGGSCGKSSRRLAESSPKDNPSASHRSREIPRIALALLGGN
jgi:hypothetical protein